MIKTPRMIEQERSDKARERLTADVHKRLTRYLYPVWAFVCFVCFALILGALQSNQTYQDAITDRMIEQSEER